jgi:hypothetical protein
MSEKELVHHMLKGLRPEIARYISILDNNSTEDIKKNIRKYETVEFMISDSYINNPNSIKTSILKEQIQQITQNTNTEVEELKNEIKKLKIEFIENNNKNISNKIDDKKNNEKQDVVCQICNKPFHTADKCFKRISCQICRKTNHTADKCRFRNKNNTNENNKQKN